MPPTSGARQAPALPSSRRLDRITRFCVIGLAAVDTGGNVSELCFEWVHPVPAQMGTFFVAVLLVGLAIEATRFGLDRCVGRLGDPALRLLVGMGLTLGVWLFLGGGARNLLSAIVGSVTVGAYERRSFYRLSEAVRARSRGAVLALCRWVRAVALGLGSAGGGGGLAGPAWVIGELFSVHPRGPGRYRPTSSGPRAPPFSA